MTAESGSLCSRWKCELQSTSRSLGVPEHEGFGNGLDRVAQPQVGLDGLLRQALLFGDVDGDADQVQSGIGRALAEFAAHAQPDPVAVGVPHAEGVVDVVDLARR